MNPLEWFRAPMIQDDAGRPVRRFCSFFSAKEPKHADDGVREVYRRIAAGCSVSTGAWLLCLSVAVVVGLIVGVVVGGLVHTATARNAQFRDLDLQLGWGAGVATAALSLLAGLLMHDRGRTVSILRTLRAEGRCGSCGRPLHALGSDQAALTTCGGCSARWKYDPVPTHRAGGKDRSTIVDEESGTVTDLTGRVLRVASVSAVEARADTGQLLGSIGTRSRVRRGIWIFYLILAACACLTMYSTWFMSAGGVWRWLLGAFILYFAFVEILSIRHQAKVPLNRFVPGSFAGTLLTHELCPACVTTLDVGNDPRQTRSCRGCDAVWPGAAEMTRYGYPGMTPGICPACSYDVSGCAHGPDRLVTCPECGSQSRLAHAARPTTAG